MEVEAVNDGVGQPWPAVQIDAYKRGCAAILRRIGRGAGDCVAHREYSSEGKIDPAGIDMAAFRRDVQALIDRKPTQAQGGSTMWAEQFENSEKKTANYGAAIWWIDKRVRELWDQLVKGWPQLGTNAKGDPLTLVDSQADQTARLARLEAKLDQLLGGK